MRERDVGYGPGKGSDELQLKCQSHAVAGVFHVFSLLIQFLLQQLQKVLASYMGRIHRNVHMTGVDNIHAWGSSLFLDYSTY